MDENNSEEITLKTGSGILLARKGSNGFISVNMGHPQLDWDLIPLKEKVDLLELPIEGRPAAVGMGNPHCVFVVDDVNLVELVSWGSKIETHELFPKKTNVEFIQIIDQKNIRQRTFERGAGETLACGSGACAVAVVAHLKGLTERNVNIYLDGGQLSIDWSEDGIWMTGPTSFVFKGILSSEFLESVK